MNEQLENDSLSGTGDFGAKPLVAIVGRPNVGKSALFNRLVGARMAIIEDVPGTTRDRNYADVEWSGREFTLVDTGGLEPDPGGDIARLVKDQAEQAIEESDLVLFVLDTVDGLTATDLEIADVLRRTEKPIIVVGSKADNEERRLASVQFYEVGLGDVVAVSAYHGTGTGDLLDMVLERLPTAPKVGDAPKVLRIAIVGRPNVGKSSLLNAIVGEERAIVHPTPGTTRDAIDTVVEFRGEPLVLIDTAGIRRRGHIEVGLEKYSVLRTMRALARCDVAVLVLDSDEGITAQDNHLAGFVVEAEKGLVVAANKWDLVNPRQREGVVARIRQELNFVSWAPVLLISALTGDGVIDVLETALRVQVQRERRVPKDELDEVVKGALESHPPPPHAGRPVRMTRVSQIGINPPTFVFHVNDEKNVHFSYQRYLENRLRQHFVFEGAPVKLVFRPRGGRRPR